MADEGAGRRPTSRGHPLSKEVIDRATADAEKGFELDQLRRRGGRPVKGTGPGDVVPVRLDETMRSALEQRAQAENLSVSDVIRRSLRDQTVPDQESDLVALTHAQSAEHRMSVVLHELDRIEHALASAPLDHRLFERCAQDLLSEVYPGLSPISGGSDWGRDADIHSQVDQPPVRLLATSSRTREGVRKNMLQGLRSMTEHGVPFHRVVLANPALLTRAHRESLSTSAQKFGAIIEFFDRGFFASRLRRDGEWRQRLLGLSGDPITLSRVPTELAESQWATMPLVGRTSELERVSGQGDFVVFGSPGLGKTRLLSEIDGAFFVDANAPYDQLADDIRWFRPAVVIVDDAGSSLELLRHLIRLRQVETDVGVYRIIATCWPHEVDKLQDEIHSATTFELDYLERGDLDQVLVTMGITGQLARVEILDQAEGRPGWVVALGDLLLRARDSASLLNGKALLGHVERYLRRAAVPAEAIHFLAALALLGKVSEDELDDLADGLGVPRTRVVQLMSTTAKSGLIDVISDYSYVAEREVRTYVVRPPMLARALVAEHIFATDVPAFDLEEFLKRWPSRLGEMAEAAIYSSLFGVTRAIPVARKFFRQVLDTGFDTHAVASLSMHYARLSKDAALEILELVRKQIDDFDGTDSPSAFQVELFVNLAYLISRWYLIEEAVHLIMDAAVHDSRPTNPNPGHPLRKLADLVHDFHPELPRPADQRTLVARAAEHWIEKDASPPRWPVFGAAIQSVLSLSLRSALTAPGSPRTFQLIETVADAEEIKRIYEQLWPIIRERLRKAPVEVRRLVVEAALDWLRVGGGYDKPFGQSHPEESIAAAKEYGERLVEDLIDLVEDHLGLSMYLRDGAERHDLSVPISIPSALSSFFVDLDRSEEDFQETEKNIVEGICETVRSWVDEDPEGVIDKLLRLREELNVAGLTWPQRIWIACDELSKIVDNPATWLHAAIERDLLPEGAAFARRAVAVGALGQTKILKLLEVPALRWELMREALTNTTLETQMRESVIAQLSYSDYRLLQTLFLREEIDNDGIRRLLTLAKAEAKGVVSAALHYAHVRDHEWSPPFENSWLEGILEVDLFALEHYEATQLCSFLARKFPNALAEMVSRRIDATSDSEVGRVLPFQCFDVLPHLPSAQKSDLWKRHRGREAAKWVLRMHLAGVDISWIEKMMDEALMTIEDALATYTGLGPHPSLEDMARAFVPRGVDPQRIAGLAEFGTRFGEESDHYRSLVKRFSEMAKSSNQSERAVGEAGVRLFSEYLENALDNEHKKRIRGQI